MWMVVALERRRFGTCVAAFCLLLACKEEFPFVGPILAAVLWRRGQRPWAFVVAVVSLMWGLGVFFVRPLVVGPTVAYHAVPFEGLLEHPATYFWDRVASRDLRVNLTNMLVPVVPLGLWLHTRYHRRPSVILLALAGPVVALRFLTMKWGYHYHAVTMAAAVAAMVPALEGRNVPRWLLGATCGLLVWVNQGHLRDAAGLLRHGVQPTTPYCPLDSGRLASLEQGRALVREHGHGRRLLIGMNLLPRLVDLPNTFSVDMPDSDSAGRQPYDVVFFEKPPHGMRWGPTHDRLNILLERWRQQPGTRVWLDDANVFVAEGSFSDL
jgi:hypothetical protein